LPSVGYFASLICGTSALLARSKQSLSFARTGAACWAIALLLALPCIARAGDSPDQRPASTAPQATIHPPENPQLLAARVLAIFEEKCAECHDEATGRPRGDFGYVLDLASVAANPDMIVRGKPEQSELYLMVEDDEMPGDEASVPPLTVEEKDIVRRWVAAGAPAELPAPPVSVTGTTQESSPEAGMLTPKPPLILARKYTTGQRILRILGQFHPPSSHFPIALLIAAFPAEAMWKLTRKPSWKATVRFCVMFGAMSAVVTAALGWCNGAFSNYVGVSAQVLTWHRWLGTGTAAWAVLTAVLSELAHKEGNPRSMRYTFRGVLAVGIVLVSVAGYLGASLVYGLKHFTW
jgi:uncharacterized membrane protein/mono/diheme cytochrome c family protein